MILFLDTEFTDFTKVDLISLGLVSEDQTYEYYVEINDHVAEWRSQFVNDTIMPLLDLPTYGLSHHTASYDLVDWITSLPDNNLTIVCDFPGDWFLMNKLILQQPNANNPGGALNVVSRKDGSTFCVIAQMINFALTSKAHANGHYDPSVLQKAFQTLQTETENYYTIDSRRHHALVDAKANAHGWRATLNSLGIII